MKYIRHYLIPGLLWAALYAVVFWICYKRLDPDFGWHLEAGRYIAHHGIPDHDVFSYTAPDFRWINHEWLSDLLMAGLYRVHGIFAISLVFSAAWVGAVAVAARKHWPVAVIGAIGLMDYFWNRPLAFTLFFLALMPLIWKSQRRWLMLPLFLLWANLHGGFALGLAILGFLIVWERQWKSWWLLPSAVLATFINPYGPRLYVEIWRTMSDHQLASRISEWGPLQLNGWNGAFIFIALAALVTMKRKFIAQSVMSWGLLGAAIVSTRQFMPFVVLSLPRIAEGFAEGMRRLGFMSTWQKMAVNGIAAALLALTFASQLPIRSYYPEAAVTSLREHPCDGNTYNEYNHGGYLIWQLPGKKVYIDGRMPSWKPAGGSVMDRWYRVEDGGEFAKSEFKRLNITCAVITTTDVKMNKLLGSEGWDHTAVDPVATLWRKNK